MRSSFLGHVTSPLFSAHAFSLPWSRGLIRRLHKATLLGHRLIPFRPPDMQASTIFGSDTLHFTTRLNIGCLLTPSKPFSYRLWRHTRRQEPFILIMSAITLNPTNCIANNFTICMYVNISMSIIKPPRSVMNRHKKNGENAETHRAKENSICLCILPVCELVFHDTTEVGDDSIQKNGENAEDK
ncbi:hypothetical protein AVEN_103120-1 [Araneus ventricosus]|uniref:Uncharacterized protein n=1 Tax=Araneus ventricosus TaxID=182803 RepID=A0A4Y2GNZ8_ARAVE|nr:hypothetical protein AVEN_103120-1 [Araneus ventricosus]